PPQSKVDGTPGSNAPGSPSWPRSAASGLPTRMRQRRKSDGGCTAVSVLQEFEVRDVLDSMHPMTQNQDSVKLDIAADSMGLPCFAVVIVPEVHSRLAGFLFVEDQQLNLAAHLAILVGVRL